MYLTISKICTVSSRSVLSKTTVRSLMPWPHSCANGMVAFAKVQNNLESSSLLGEKNKIIVELFGRKEKNVIYMIMSQKGLDIL